MTPEHPPETALVPRTLAALVAQVCRFPRFVLAVAVLLAGFSLCAFCTQLEYHTQRNDLISPDKDYLRRWQEYLNEFGNDDDMVVVVEGSDRARMKAALEDVAARIRQQPGQFDRLFYKVELSHLQDRALLYLSPKHLTQIQESLRAMSPLLELGPLAWHMFTLQRLVHEAGDRVKALPSEGPLSPGDRQFLTQLVSINRSASAALNDPASYRNPWHGLVSEKPEHQELLAEPQYFFSGDGALAFLLVRPVKESGSFTAARQSVQALRDVVATVRPLHPQVEMGVTGLPVLETDEMTASQSDTQSASWWALAGVTLLYVIVFRSWRAPFLTVGTLLFGTAWAMGWLTLTVGHLNLLSATFAMMLIGMGDYGVLWVTRYDQERAAGAGVHLALRQTALHAGPGILTAAVTAALAFFAAMLADFQGVAELGWIAGWGVLLCAVSCFTVLPAVLRLIDRRQAVAAPVIRPGAFDAWLPALAGRPRWVVGGGLILTAVLALCALRTTYDDNLLRLQAAGLESVRWELKLIGHTAGASWHALSYTTTPQEALRLKARYESSPQVSRVVEVASLVPRDQDTKLPQLRDIQHRLRNLPARWALVPRLGGDAERLKRELERLAAALQPLAQSAKSPVLTELHAQVYELLGQLNRVPVGEAGERLRQFEQRLTSDLADDLQRLRDVARPEPIRVEDLPAALRERYIGSSGKWLLRIFGKGSLWDYEPLKKFVRRIKRVDPEATGKPFTTLAGLRAMKYGFLWAAVYALGAIVLVLAADFRSVLHVLLALAPLAMGVVATLGVLALCGVSLNPANMIAFPLIVGVGIDNGVHVLHDFRDQAGRRYVLSRATGKGILVAALTTMLGFGTLTISSHRGLVSLGLALTLGVGCCMLAALLFLPALLSLGRRTSAAMKSAVIPVEEGRYAA